MNIVTICSTNWLDHLDRFIHYTKRAMPTADIHLLMVTAPAKDTPEQLQVLQKALMRYVKQVRFTKPQEMPGRLMFYDWVRSTLLDVFQLTEALYTDVDVDILQDLSDLSALAPEASILACQEPLRMQDNVRALTAYGFDPNVTHYQIGMLYMRRSFKQDFEQILRDGKIPLAGEFMPGSGIWNVILHRNQAPAIPLTHHACWQRGPALFTTKAIHFNGSYWQPMRLYCRYASINPNTLQFGPTPTGRFLLQDIP